MSAGDISGGCQSKVSLFSPAKLNLGLRISGRRPDGYHQLESLFWPIAFGDRIELEPAPTKNQIEMAWASDAPFPEQKLPAASDNLVGQLLKRFPFPERTFWRASIEKRIPVGGGLGGGSSNVGTLLRHFGKEYSISGLDNLATELGADVPFFLDPRPTWVTGIGEIREPLDLDANAAGISFVLLMLPESTSTQHVFRSLERSEHTGLGKIPKIRDRESLLRYLATCRNDLESAAARTYPLIAEALAALRKTSALYVGLSGTGSTCFGIYADQASREKSFQELQFFCRRGNCKSVEAKTFSNLLLSDR